MHIHFLGKLQKWALALLTSATDPPEFLRMDKTMICLCKVEKVLKGSLDSIPSPSVKIQILGGKVCLRCKGKTLLGVSLITLSKLSRQ